jgi:exosortase E/protease (VPEID-CTERM system)
VSTPLSNTALPISSPRAGLGWRLLIVAAVLSVETLLLSYLIQLTPIDWLTGPARTVREIQHWLFRFIIVYAVALAMLGLLRGAESGSRAPAERPDIPWRGGWAAAHLLLLPPFAILTAALYSGSLALPFWVVAVAWHGCALAFAFALFAAAAPPTLWMQAARRTGVLPLYALLAAAAAVFAIQASQRLWEPTAAFTFRLVRLALVPLIPDLHGDFGTLTLSTGRFAVTVSEKCSGLEGMGLMVAFCATWLWCFRREYRFPRALVIIPAAVLLAFFLNVLRIAALVAIGNAGYPGVAMVGFHSQAGWIAFNSVALGVAVLARRSAWMRAGTASSPAATGAAPPPAAAGAAAARDAVADDGNATAAYLMPLLAILAAGMIAHALSAGFELLYPLRLIAAAAFLWMYRGSYAALDLRISWRAPAVGALIAALWLLFAHFLIPPSPRPEALSALPGPLRALWITARVLAAAVTVPIAEELAYRGYLLRRLVNADFQAVKFADVPWSALAACAAAFGIMHGAMWFPALLAGLAYGALAIKTGRIGEAMAAHATTNALLAGAVLLFGEWGLW